MCFSHGCYFCAVAVAANPFVPKSTIRGFLRSQTVLNLIKSRQKKSTFMMPNRPYTRLIMECIFIVQYILFRVTNGNIFLS